MDEAHLLAAFHYIALNPVQAKSDGNAAATDVLSTTRTATVDATSASTIAPATFAPAYGFGKMYTAETALQLMGSIARTLFKANICVEVVNYGA